MSSIEKSFKVHVFDINEKKKSLLATQKCLMEIKPDSRPSLTPKPKRPNTSKQATDSKPFSDWYQYIHDHTDVLGMTVHNPGASSDISICTLIVNSLSADKLSCILAVVLILESFANRD